MIYVPREALSAIASGSDEKYMRSLADTVSPFVKESVILLKGEYGFKQSVEALEDHAQMTGIVSDHTVDGPLHCFTIRHGIGSAWSAFVRAFLGILFSEFVPAKEVKYAVDENIVSARVSLGSDWDEHDY